MTDESGMVGQTQLNSSVTIRSVVLARS